MNTIRYSFRTTYFLKPTHTHTHTCIPITSHHTHTMPNYSRNIHTSPCLRMCAVSICHWSSIRVKVDDCCTLPFFSLQMCTVEYRMRVVVCWTLSLSALVDVCRRRPIHIIVFVAVNTCVSLSCDDKNKNKKKGFFAVILTQRKSIYVYFSFSVWETISDGGDGGGWCGKMQTRAHTLIHRHIPSPMHAWYSLYVDFVACNFIHIHVISVHATMHLIYSSCIRMQTLYDKMIFVPSYRFNYSFFFFLFHISNAMLCAHSHSYLGHENFHSLFVRPILLFWRFFQFFCIVFRTQRLNFVSKNSRWNVKTHF